MFLSLNRFIKKIFKLITILLITSILIGLAISIIFPIGFKDSINKYSKEYQVDPFLVAAIINVESKYAKDATSPKDARGLMQVGPQTGSWASEVLDIDNYSEELLFDPKVNIRIGIWYIKQLKNEFNDNLSLVLAAYNAGSGNVNKWLRDENYSKDGKNLSTIPFLETEEYIEKVQYNYKAYSFIYKHYMEKPDSMNSIYTDVIISIRTFLSNILKSLRQGGIL